jgi:hypothetical protein
LRPAATLARSACHRRGHAAARVTVATSFMAGLVPEEFSRGPVAVIPLGAERLSSGPRVEGPPWRLLRVASINRVKDHPTLLRALALLVDRGLDVHLDIVRWTRWIGQSLDRWPARSTSVPASRFMGFSRPIGWRPSTPGHTCTWCRRATRPPASWCSKRRRRVGRRLARRSATSRTGIPIARRRCLSRIPPRSQAQSPICCAIRGGGRSVQRPRARGRSVAGLAQFEDLRRGITRRDGSADL